MVEPYNSVLTTHSAMEHSDVTFLVDNDAVFSICKNKLEVTTNSPRLKSLKKVFLKKYSKSEFTQKKTKK